MKDKNILIKITAHPNYLSSQSQPSNARFIWSYEISITNASDVIVQLLNRHWKITDMRGKVEEIDGVGVIGLQPVIKPGKTFSYTSFCQLTTPQGTMEGYYEFQDLEDFTFKSPIDKFILTAPSTVTKTFHKNLH